MCCVKGCVVAGAMAAGTLLGTSSEVLRCAVLSAHYWCAYTLSPQALLGKARLLEVQGQLQAAADLAGELAVR